MYKIEVIHKELGLTVSCNLERWLTVTYAYQIANSIYGLANFKQAKQVTDKLDLGFCHLCWSDKFDIYIYKIKS